MELDYLALLRTELTIFQNCLREDLSVPIEHCGDWDLRDLAEHLGRGNLWAATAIRERRGDYEAPLAPDDIAPWFAETARALTNTLEIDPATEAWTFAPPHTVAFWRRRRCLETLVHRWDAQHALDQSGELDAALCGDGIAEVIEVFVPRQVKRGRATPPEAAVRFTATDLGASWVLGPGEPIAEMTGTADELLLALWNRRPMPWATLSGDHDTARKALRGPLVS